MLPMAETASASESAAFYPKTPVPGQSGFPAEEQKSPFTRAFRLHGPASVLMNVPVLGFPEEQYPDDHGHDSHHDRVPQSVINVARGRHHRRRGERQHAAEPAVADVIGQ